MPEHHHKKQFLKLPKYPGGSAAFKEAVAASLRYPEAALAAGVEGSVMVEFDIHDNGLVSHPRVLKGIGHGCDEEAMRVVKLLRFESVKNRGVRVKMTTKTSINFKLPAGVRINYSAAPKTETAPTPETSKEKPAPVNYEYTITF
ncbi:MAG: energy transducer TonB [Bacteroidales bacterium]